MLKVAGGAGTTTGSLTYAGTWNASSNSPTLTSSVGTLNNYYVVSIAGSTNLNGISSWQIGDWAIFNGTVWERIDGGAYGTVSNVATGTGLTGGPITTTGTISLANTTVTAGSYGNASTVGNFTVNAQGQLTAASNTAIAISVGAVSGAVPNTVNVLTSGLLSGGGALTGNVTVSLTSVPSSNVTGLGTMATQNANAVAITGGTANLTSANITYSGASSNIGTLSVGGAANITNDTGLIASFVGNATTYSYVAVQNKLTSNTAYGSYSLYNDLGTIYADFGINSSNYSYVAAGFPNNSFSLPNATFIQSGANSDLTIGTNGANAVHFLANGSTSTSDALTINANNTVTIANLAAGTSSTATFATPSLPLVPAGYLTINLNGTNVKIPYYAV